MLRKQVVALGFSICSDAEEMCGKIGSNVTTNHEHVQGGKFALADF